MSAVPAPRTELAPADLQEVLGALEHAAGYLTERASQPCADCARHPAALCEPHAEDLDQAGRYRQVLGRLGGAA